MMGGGGREALKMVQNRVTSFMDDPLLLIDSQLKKVGNRRSQSRKMLILLIKFLSTLKGYLNGMSGNWLSNKSHHRKISSNKHWEIIDYAISIMKHTELRMIKVR